MKKAILVPILQCHYLTAVYATQFVKTMLTIIE